MYLKLLDRQHKRSQHRDPRNILVDQDVLVCGVGPVTGCSETVKCRDTKRRYLVSVASAAHKLVGERKSDLLTADLCLLKERQIRLRLLHRHLAIPFDDFPCGSRNRRPDLVDRLADPVALGGCLYAAVDLDLRLRRDNVRFCTAAANAYIDGSSSLVICQFLDCEDLMCQLLDADATEILKRS